jgi:hypothetical protein
MYCTQIAIEKLGSGPTYTFVLDFPWTTVLNWREILEIPFAALGMQSRVYGYPGEHFCSTHSVSSHIY